MSLTTPVELLGEHVILKPLDVTQAEVLKEAVCDGELYNLWYTRVPRPEQMTAEIERRLDLQKSGSMLPFILKTEKRASAGHDNSHAY